MKKTTLLIKIIQRIHLPLLIFLILVLDVKFVVKLFGLAFMIIYSMNFRLGLSWKKSRLPLFYALIIGLEIIKYFIITRNYSVNYMLVFCMGILQWTFSLLSIHFIKSAIEQDVSQKIHHTIRAFYALNFLVSFFFLLLLLIHPAWLSYWGQGTELNFNHPSAGDAILGISFDASTVNASINCFGLIYFLYKKDFLFSVLSALVIVLCTSNIIFIFTLGILAVMIFTVRSRQFRLRILLTAFSLVLIYIPYSPKNRQYMRDYFVQLYVVNNVKQAIDTNTYHLRGEDSMFAFEGQDSISNDSSYSYNKSRFGNAVDNLVSFKNIHTDSKTGYVRIPEAIYQSKPGKFVSFIQTFFYLKHNIKQLLFGSGIGNFSSKLAFRASGVKTLGTYPRNFRYTSPDFAHNHLFTFRYYYEANASKHSVLNYPFSVYNQILGEYGLMGALIFMIFYLGYFASRYRRLSYGKYLLLALLGFFMTDYCFESFSLVILFELFILLDIEEGMEAGTPTTRQTNQLLENRES